MTLQEAKDIIKYVTENPRQTKYSFAQIKKAIQTLGGKLGQSW